MDSDGFQRNSGILVNSCGICGGLKSIEITGSFLSEHNGQRMGIFEHGEDAVEWAATLYENFTFVGHVDWSQSIFKFDCAPCPFLR